MTIPEANIEEAIIRAACPEDLPVLRQFEQGVIGAERPFDVTLKPDPIQYYNLEAMLVNPDVKLVVASRQSQLIGSGYARLEAVQPFLKYTRHAYLGFMYVLPEFRGRGINQRILKVLESWAGTQGITELRLEVYTYNQPAVSAYEKAGFQPLLVQMRKEVEP
ncbi:MAG TPA: GNAT family N-acetyltransferase [Flavisolibacter sp.]|jgi:GNAT superfamily N-acetyltransferase|nr:GNAT family N-acetyltransferase [Flavisolibacter sp.]